MLYVEIDVTIPGQYTTSSSKSRGSPPGANTVRAINHMGMDAWKHSLEYGKRWRVEIFFSALKRTVGEVIRAEKLEYLIKEVVMKVYCYFLLRRSTVMQ